MENIFIEADKLSDQGARFAMYDQLQKMLMDDLPVIPIVWRGCIFL